MRSGDDWSVELHARSGRRAGDKGGCGKGGGSEFRRVRERLDEPNLRHA
jgi:hypothetical protein